MVITIPSKLEPLPSLLGPTLEVGPDLPEITICPDARRLVILNLRYSGHASPGRIKRQATLQAAEDAVRRGELMGNLEDSDYPAASSRIQAKRMLFSSRSTLICRQTDTSYLDIATAIPNIHVL